MKPKIQQRRPQTESYMGTEDFPLPEVQQRISSVARHGRGHGIVMPYVICVIHWGIYNQRYLYLLELFCHVLYLCNILHHLIYFNWFGTYCVGASLTAYFHIIRA